MNQGACDLAIGDPECPRTGFAVLKVAPMVQVRRTGMPSPAAVFEELRPLRERLIKMQQAYRPFGPDYLILSAVTKALDTAA